MSTLGQLGIILAFGLCGEIIAYLLPFSFPPSVIGLVLLLCALKANVLKEAQFQSAADFLSKNMAFFFLPSAVNIIQSYPSIKAVVLPLLLICIISTICTFVASYAAAHLIQLLSTRRRA